MVLHENPVADLHAVAVHGSGLSECVRDHQRNELFGELVRTEIVGTPGCHRVKSVRLKGGADHEIRSGLRGRVGVVRLNGGKLGETAFSFHAAVDLIGRDLEETGDMVFHGRADEELGPENVRSDEGFRAQMDAAVDMAFRGEVDDGIELVGLEDRVELGLVRDVGPDKRVARVFFQGGQVFKVAGIGQRVQVDHLVAGPGGKNMMNEIASNETGAACDEQNHQYRPFIQGSCLGFACPINGAAICCRQQPRPS